MSNIQLKWKIGIFIFFENWYYNNFRQNQFLLLQWLKELKDSSVTDNLMTSVIKYKISNYNFVY